MDALVLAAGLGSRLRPLTDQTPKALIEVGGVSMLERIARRLVEAGAGRIVVNAHHHADQIERSAERLAVELGIEVLVSLEEEAPLETGGGLLHAAPLLGRDAPFFVHNVDILTDFDLRRMVAAHLEGEALATLAVNHRSTARQLLFDGGGLYGRSNTEAGTVETIRQPSAVTDRIAFAGVHVVSPEIFGLITERGAFSILDLYLRLAAAGRIILPFDVTRATWLEIGTPERLERARAAIVGAPPGG